MEKVQEFIFINELFAVYGKTLTDKQEAIMKDYYVFNLSIQEIADHLGISKAGVSDALKVATNHLTLLEEKVGHIAYKERMRNFIAALEATSLTEEQKTLLTRVQED